MLGFTQRVADAPFIIASNPLAVDVKVHNFNTMRNDDLRALLDLTNAQERGDMTDTGMGAGSCFREWILARMRGFNEHDRSWAVVASTTAGPIAWCHAADMTSHIDAELACVLPALSVGFYVNPTTRRSGLGSLLLREASRLAQSVGRRRLLAQPWNVSSSRFFASAGFKELRPFFSGWANGLSVLYV